MMLSKKRIDALVYQRRQQGDDSTYALAASIEAEVRKEIEAERQQVLAATVLAEREACATTCQALWPHSGYHPMLRQAGNNCATAIRARTQQAPTGAPMRPPGGGSA